MKISELRSCLWVSKVGFVNGVLFVIEVTNPEIYLCAIMHTQAAHWQAAKAQTGLYACGNTDQPQALGKYRGLYSCHPIPSNTEASRCPTVGWSSTCPSSLLQR